MSFTHHALRNAFANFWGKKNHLSVPPASLVLKEDATTLFTSSGMQPLVAYLEGLSHPLGKRIYNIQPCFRAVDIDEIGDNRHTTFFEMMGNWSLGDYFKKDHLAWAWEFFTQVIELPKENLYVTVFEGNEKVSRDEESYAIWKQLGVPEDHIHFYGVEKNWWSRAGTPDQMPVDEIGGPDSEIFYQFDVPHDKKWGQQCHPNCDCGRFLEIGNSVFIQYRKRKDGALEELPQKNVDFGGGLERILAASQNNPDIFQTDVFLPIIQKIEEITKKTYFGHEKLMRVVADHIKAASFLIADGVTPYKQEHGSVLRKLIRDSIDAMRLLGVNHPILSLFTKEIVELYEVFYQNLKKYKDKILHEVEWEDERYYRDVLTPSYSELNKLVDILKKEGLMFGGKITQDGKRVIDGKILFDLKQSKGISLQTITNFLMSNNLLNELELDLEGYNRELEKHRVISRAGLISKLKGG